MNVTNHNTPTTVVPTSSINHNVGDELPALANSTSHDSAELFHTAHGVDEHTSEADSRVLETNPEDISSPNEAIVEMDHEVEYENDSYMKTQQRGNSIKVSYGSVPISCSKRNN